jgi:gas vesicle protein
MQYGEGIKMFGFLAAFGPVGIVAAVVGTVATAVIASDNNSSSRSDNSGDLKRKAKEDEKSSINEKIESYKSDSKKMIKNKYKENITYTGKGVKSEKNPTSNRNVIKTHLNTLKSENREIEKVIEELKVAKNAI